MPNSLSTEVRAWIVSTFAWRRRAAVRRTYAIDFPMDSESLTPKQIGRLVAEKLCAVLPGSWSVTAHGIRCIEAGQTTDIELQRSTYSRRDVGVWFYPRLVVTDAGLLKWTAQNPELTNRPADGRIFNSLFVNFTSINEVFVSPRPKAMSNTSATFEDFVEVLIGEVLPQREALREPRTLTILPARWLMDVRGMLMWSVSAGQEDLCWPLVERFIQRNERARAPFIRGVMQHELGHPESMSNYAEALGHLVGRLRRHGNLGDSPGWLKEQTES